MTSETAEAILCIVRDQWRWTSEMDLTRSWWVPNRDAPDGYYEFAPRRGLSKWSTTRTQDEPSIDSRRGQSKRDSSELQQLLKER